MTTQFGAESFADNPEPRCPCVLVLDTSSSMSGPPIDQLNAGLQVFRSELLTDSLASKRVEVAVIRFGGTAELVSDFTTVETFNPPRLVAAGGTPMGQAIHQAIDAIQRRKEVYRSNGIQYYRPWVFMITDGGPTDEWQSAAQKVKASEAAKSLIFYSVGVEHADFGTLGQFSDRTTPLKLKGLSFGEMFQWLSSSLKSASASKPGENMSLANPTGPKGWGEVVV